MAIRNTKLGGTDITDGYIYTVADFNETYDAITDRDKIKDDNQNSAILENSINIARLQYATSMSDISHDYVGVDIMSDASGCANTINTTGTTAYFTSQGLTGKYMNVETYTTSPTANLVTGTGNLTSAPTYTTIAAYGDAGYGYSTFYVIAAAATGSPASASSDATISVTTPSWLGNMTNYVQIDFNIAGWSAGNIEGPGGSTHNMQVVSNSDDNFSTKNGINFGSDDLNWDRKYSYVNQSGSSWNLYKTVNSTTSLVTTINRTSFPSITFRVTSEEFQASLAITSVRIYGFYALTSGRSKTLKTNTVSYSSSIANTQMELQKSGSGVITYDVYEADDAVTPVATNLPLNTLNATNSTSTAHTYAINMSANATVEVYSYAIFGSEL